MKGFLPKILLAMFSLAVCSATGAEAEFRGLWVDAFGPGFFNTNQVSKLVADCRKYNFNAVLVQMRRRGDAFYLPGPSNPDPRTHVLANNFDALAEIIRQCHTGTPRIEVHCWLVSHFIWAWKKPPRQKGHVFNFHPEYLTKDSLGQKLFGDRYYLDPGHPGANQWIHDVAVDIVRRYDIDGLHWDYFRYPSRDSGYNETAIKRYNEEFGLIGEPAPGDERFCEWRRRQVTDCLRWISADLWEIKPRLVVSTAVFANYDDSYAHRLADWAAWSREGIVDIIMPMNFTTNNSAYYLPRLRQANQREGARLVYMGIGAYMNSPENTLVQLQAIHNTGLKGMVLYSYRYPNRGKADLETVFRLVKDRHQPNWAQSPEQPWKTKSIIKGTVTNSDTGEAVYNADVTLKSSPARTLKTEPHGKFAFFDLVPGDYVLQTTFGRRSREQRVKIAAGEVRNVDVALQP